MPQLLIGLLISLIGVAATAGLIPPLADYTYPIVWWGLLLMVDGYNWRRHKLSLWRNGPRRFLLITVPVSVLFWLLFEIMNLPSPQWRYKGAIDNLNAQVLFGFIAFSTVIPIMAESYWLIAGEFCLPPAFSQWFRKWRSASILLGLALASIPFFNGNFWFNQGIWLAPALVLLTFTKIRPCPRSAPFIRALILSGLLAGFFWELLNYWARTHWEYIILPHAPHLFQMPLPGYLGFIPFALTAMVVYERQTRVPPRIAIAVLLYAAAFAALYLLTILYMHRGLWLFQ